MINMPEQGVSRRYDLSRDRTAVRRYELMLYVHAWKETGSSICSACLSLRRMWLSSTIWIIRSTSNPLLQKQCSNVYHHHST